jgi:iron complex outermembrane receptor protein
MNRSQRAIWASRAAIAIAATTASLAHAADAPAPASLELEEVTVTATKRAESLQSVPVSVTALTAGVLERGNVRELGDLVKLSPGLTIAYGSQPGNFSISMRGIGTFSNGIAVESDVAVVVDDVPMGFQAEAFQDLIDVERVEVLRGPQSTLFGKSAIAGVLNIVTSAPTHEWTGKANALITDDQEKRGSFTVSGPQQYRACPPHGCRQRLRRQHSTISIPTPSSISPGQTRRTRSPARAACSTSGRCLATHSATSALVST